MQSAKRAGKLLPEGLTAEQRVAVRSTARRLLVVAGAGSGKTEVMARRVAWRVATEGVPQGSITAFTFTDRAAEEMKFRVRAWLERTKTEDDTTVTGIEEAAGPTDVRP